MKHPTRWPFPMGASEVFEATFRGGDCQEHFCHGTGVAASASEVEEPKSKKSKAFRARLAPPKPTEVENVPPPTDFNHSGSGFLGETETRAHQAEFHAGLRSFHQHQLLHRSLIP
jgi:hypothetical protein